jgi:hypothetical protein
MRLVTVHVLLHCAAAPTCISLARQRAICSLCFCPRTSDPCAFFLPTTFTKSVLDHHLKLMHATMNASLMNTTSPCPTFLAGFPKATVPYCALPLCANSTAVMAQCCEGSQVFPYHSAGGPDSGFDNITDLNALWCHVENSSASTWSDCISSAHGPMGLCSASSSSSQKGRASRNITVGLQTTVGLALIVALFHSIF